MRKKERKPEAQGKDNLIGNKQNEKVKATALQTLPSAKLMEKNRQKEGYVWLSKGKTSKQVHPNNIQKNIDDGWKPKNNPRI